MKINKRSKCRFSFYLNDNIGFSNCVNMELTEVVYILSI